MKNGATMVMATKKPINWQGYRIRKCMSLHTCAICGKDITYLQRYYDGGYGTRAHTTCADKQEGNDDEEETN